METSKAKIEAAVEARLLSRFKNLGIKPGSKKGAAEEAAFLSGAATALHAVFGEREDRLTDYVPPLWVLFPMTGRSVVAEILRTSKKGGK